jgi:hypothetical protein
MKVKLTARVAKPIVPIHARTGSVERANLQ